MIDASFLPITDKKLMPWSFRTRWRIEGRLFACTALHIGSGRTVEHPDLTQEGTPVKISAQEVDHTGRPFIPGAALKGCLRAWIIRRCRQRPDLMVMVEKIFGRGVDQNGREDPGQGGLAEFHDARLAAALTDPLPLPHWNDDRQTFIEAANSINRHTRTAADQHLIHTECVPAGVGFDLVISGCADFAVRDPDHLTAFLLAVLEGFNDRDDPLFLGADTANGKGRLRWEPQRVFKLTAADAAAWVKAPDRGMAGESMRPLDSSQFKALRQKAAWFDIPASAGNFWSIAVILEFDSHFLVNDPPGQRELDDSFDPSDVSLHRPRVNVAGDVILPAKSFKGALRSQAERILRTMGGVACDPSNSETACLKSVENEDDLEKLCLVCKLFGASGFRSPVKIDDFILKPGDYECEIQEFVAIDRFTGGGKKSAKYNAQAIYRPVLTGRLKVDRSLPEQALGLLALTLRDLKEGDITFGFGAAKGFGACRAKIAIFEDKALGKEDRMLKEKMINGLEQLRFMVAARGESR